jgi:beta-glucosidase
MGLLVAMMLAAASPAYAQQAGDPEAALVDSLLAKMTLEEKLGQLVQYSGRWAQTGPDVPQGGDEEIRAGRVGSFLNIHGAEPTCRIQRLAVEESRLGIPLLFAHDVIHGFRTIFPMPLAEAAAFDPALAERTARIAAREATASGLHWTFAPMVDIARDARWSRIVEGAGEDPHLGAVLAAARVRGFQGHTREGLAADTTMMATAKHFAAYGGAEAGRDYNTVDVSERTLREVYFPPFKAAVDAGVQSLMSAFNEIGGVPATGSRRLFTELLRDEWGFDGVVVSDYTAIWELIHHGIAADSAAAGRIALEAGVDVDMVDGIYIKNLIPIVESGALPMATVDEAVRRVLRAKYRVGLFDDPYRYCDPNRADDVLLTEEHRRVARAAAQRSIVLLKNEADVLPLSKNMSSIAVIGALAADSLSALGSWAAAGQKEDALPILTGIRQVLPDTEVRYVPGYPVPQGGFAEVVAAMLSTDDAGHEEAVQLAQEADATILVLGEHRELTGEAASRASIELPGAQNLLAWRVLEAAGDKPVVVVLTNGRPLALADLAEQAPAILETWHLGVEMGPAVADVLFGDVNPGGKLPVSFPYATGQEPLYYNARNTGRPATTHYQDRPPITTGKYTSKYIDVPTTALFPFGHGLSYTTFDFANLRLNTNRIGPDDMLAVSVEVTNTGDRAGDEVVQLYVQDEVASVTRPFRELKGFERVTLQPGETRTVTFRLGSGALRFWGPDDDWIVEPGFYTVYVGRSSADTPLTDRFELTN